MTTNHKNTLRKFRNIKNRLGRLKSNRKEAPLKNTVFYFEQLYKLIDGNRFTWKKNTKFTYIKTAVNNKIQGIPMDARVMQEATYLWFNMYDALQATNGDFIASDVKGDMLRFEEKYLSIPMSLRAS